MMARGQIFEEVVSGAELSRFIGISERRVRELRDQSVIPDNGKGKYVLGEAVRSYCGHIRPSQGGAAAGGSDGSDRDLTSERARKAKEEADRLEMQNAQTRGDLLARDDVNAAVVGAFARVRARMIGVPSKVAPIVVSMDTPAEAEAAIRGAVYEALKELAETSVTDLCGHDGGMVEDPSPAPGPDSKPMGRRKKASES
jgi:terminase small subunit / prophage DNA-packing protein